MNLRGLKEAIQILLPIFLGFVATHLVLIVYGILAHATYLPQLVPSTVASTSELAGNIGWTGVAAMLLLAFSQGGDTYTVLEAVSNNVNLLAEPRVRTGKVTMMYMALSLAFAASGIILLYLLYLLWNARQVPGETPRSLQKFPVRERANRRFARLRRRGRAGENALGSGRYA